MTHLTRLTELNKESCKIKLTNCDIKVRDEDVGIFLMDDFKLHSYTIMPSENYLEVLINMLELAADKINNEIKNGRSVTGDTIRELKL